MSAVSSRIRSAAVLVAGLALVSAACSSGGSTAAETRDTRPRRSTTSTTTTSTTAASSSPPTAPPATTSPPTAAPAPPPPSTDTCGGQREAITAALLGGELGPVPIGNYSITACRLAPSNVIWAAVNLQPNAGETVVPLIVALERVGSIWMVRGYGQDHVACDAPPPVPAELLLGC